MFNDLKCSTLRIAMFSMLALLLPSCIDEPTLPDNTKRGNFEALWSIFDTKYCYLDYKNINWDSVRTAYAPRVKEDMSEFAFFDLMGEMLAELKDGHVNLYSAFDRSRYWKWFSDYPSNFSSTLIYNQRYLKSNYRIAGGMRYNTIANDSVGYVYYADFSSNFSNTNMRYIFEQFSHCKGLIIDVRNNGGGFLSLSELLASYFFTEEKVTGYIKHKTGPGHSDFSKPTEMKTPASSLQWQRPVVVLCNRMSYSATNAFVMRMKHAPNATIIGDRTGGGAGMPLSSELPNGWMVRFSAAPMLDSNMQHTEWGIDPDVFVSLRKADADNGVDSIIETAVGKILGN